MNTRTIAQLGASGLLVALGVTYASVGYAGHGTGLCSQHDACFPGMKSQTFAWGAAHGFNGVDEEGYTNAMGQSWMYLWNEPSGHCYDVQTTVGNNTYYADDGTSGGVQVLFGVSPITLTQCN
jgi:hypothetical protein